MSKTTATKKKDENILSARDVLEMMKSEFKKSTLTLLSDDDAGTVKLWIDMGNYALNYIISGDLTKGFPYGRVTEYHGDNSTGKTLIALMCAANAQKNDNGLVFYYDPECSMDRDFARKLGADPDEIIYDDKVDTVEELETRIEGVIRMKEASKTLQPVLLILDSLAMLSTAHEMETPDKADMTKAKKLKQITRRLTRRLATNQIGFLVLNHTIANISPMPFAPKKTTTGGSAIPFLASVRLKTSIFKKIKNVKTKEVDGVIIKVECVKNKLTRPFREAQIFFDFRTISIDKCSGLAEILVNKGIFEKTKIGNKNGLIYKDEKFIEAELGKLIEKNNWLPEFNEALRKVDEADKEVVIDVGNADIEDITEDSDE